ncbi:lysophospholipid acyltransferase family protein [Mucilaginibacter myungsuensis]|uniref:Lysophospholipid acyltransferase family protein n=1 Tax=Mucilaginibacter myungsuensis TaxID=649104 RepID=A0A929PU31_9SPHI|nr:lysophospholipid acyltransferase family protein [Mucilaginibacter myungsuensis]MBE9660318.1 lysophospholipid acyltransferase family protein [Mucilaginibacter myungsuensis]MDN3600360.1 lysophospholipid acyltransferase family protein [Mucilaginibacter myungsuensis]
MIIKGLSRIGVFFLYLLSLLPFWLLYIISDVLYIILYYIIGYRRAVVDENLSNSFPEKTAEERKVIAKKYYRYLGDLIMETFKMLSISKEESRRRFSPAKPDTDQRVRDHLAQDRTVLVAAGHYGNWELSALSCSMITDKDRIVVYKPLADEVFDDMFKKMRSRFGGTPVAMKDTLRKLATLRGKPSLTVLVSDQTPVRETVQYFTQFLNQPTAIFLGIEKLANAMNAVVGFWDVRCVKRGYYTYEFVVLTTEPKQLAEYEITNMHVAYLEQMIKAEPQYWLWSHKRWKFKPEHV